MGLDYQRVELLKLEIDIDVLDIERGLGLITVEEGRYRLLPCTQCPLGYYPTISNLISNRNKIIPTLLRRVDSSGLEL